ncbi:FkbM family methyltransferase [Anabaena sp. CCY 9402-a]|uniref:FkbM family methyltransferase n=1 Tax=Anabaena sp. CCY 9402-a TaxID=3103867 RepID=UPI0039C73B87
MVEVKSKMAWLEQNSFTLSLKNRFLRLLHFIDFLVRRDTKEIRMANESSNPFEDCPDWWKLDKVSNAGKVLNGKLVMHNGIRVLPTAYQGYAHGKLMQRALGIHEPQEERLFRDIILSLPANSSMIELGSYWAYYSLWFQKVIPHARTIMVEPKLSHLNYGRYHFKMNSFKGEFLQAGIGKNEYQDGNLKITTVDQIMKSFSLERVSILHSDIQGYELEMLQGAEETLQKKAIDFLFISTHSDSLHEDCISLLKEAEYKIIDHYRISESWNPDGLIVAQSSKTSSISLIPASKR